MKLQIRNSDKFNTTKSRTSLSQPKFLTGIFQSIMASIILTSCGPNEEIANMAKYQDFLSKRITSNDKQLQELKNTNTALEARLKKAEDDLKNQKNLLDAYRKEFNDLTNLVSINKVDTYNLHTAIKDLDQRLIALNKYHNMSRDDINEQLNKTHNSLQALREEYNASQESSTTNTQKLESIIAQMTTQVQELTKRLDEMTGNQTPPSNLPPADVPPDLPPEPPLPPEDPIVIPE